MKTMADFNGSEGNEISLELASSWTANYRAANPDTTKAHFLGKDWIKSLLDQDCAEGIRVYYGIDGNGAKQLIFVAAIANQDDILDLIVDGSSPCPPDCGSANDLNS